jgi:hypothetical protein
MEHTPQKYLAWQEKTITDFSEENVSAQAGASQETEFFGKTAFEKGFQNQALEVLS